MTKALELDPLSLIINTGVGWRNFFAGRFEEALAQCLRTLEMQPEFPNAADCAADSIVVTGRIDEHQDEFWSFMEIRGATPQQIADLRSVFADSGLEGYWSWQLGVLKEEEPLSGWLRFRLVDAYAQLGRVDKAFAVLDTAFEEHPPLRPPFRRPPPAHRPCPVAAGMLAPTLRGGVETRPFL
jgi:tetratricopeptide (TPR) repeat protein